MFFLRPKTLWLLFASGSKRAKPFFTARCTLVQSAVLRSNVVCPSVYLWRWWIVITYRLEFFENNFTVSQSGAFAICRPKHQSWIYSKGSNRKFWPKVTPPCWFERRGYSIANCGRMVIAQWLQWRAYRKPPSLFRMVPSLTLYDLPFPQLYASLWHSFQWGSALQWATPNKQIDFPRSRRKINNRSLLHLSRGICCQLTSKAAVDFLIYRKSYLFNE